MNRRFFAKSLLLGCTAPLGFLNARISNAAKTGIASAHRRLILVELAGANDGLNTLVPFDNDLYHVLRPTIGLHAHDVIKLSDSYGLHQALQPLAVHWEAGEMAWVQGLGYPQANRSHFKSIALWESGGDGRQARSGRGWITHAVEHQLARNIVDPHGISLAGDLDVFASESGRWMSLDSTDKISTDWLPTQHANLSDHPTLSLVQRRLRTLDSTLSRLSDKIARAPVPPRFDGGKFGEQLRQAAIMIGAGVDTPVYRVQLSGFDTHENQSRRHAKQLKTLALGLSSFTQALKAMQEWQNTLIMTYSEFGRRAAENHSGGTDHGTAAPHLLLGGAINGGLFGEAPDLADLPDGDPSHTMDYRALYERILVDGLVTQGVVTPLGQYRDERLADLIRVA